MQASQDGHAGLVAILAESKADLECVNKVRTSERALVIDLRKIIKRLPPPLKPHSYTSNLFISKTFL